MAEQPTANVALRDAMVRHQVQLQRLTKGITNKVVSLLNDTEEDIAQQIRDRLETSAGLDSPADVRKLEGLLQRLTALRSSAFEEIDAEWHDQLNALALAEPRFLANQLEVTSPVILDLAAPAVAKLRAIVKSKPFEGRTLREWASTIQDQDIRRIEHQIRLGMTAGEDSATIARRVVGSATMKGTDGVTQITRQHAESITRTAVNFISNNSRAAFINENKAYINIEVYHATLDSRTTPVCRGYDGKRFEVGTGPRPPLHWSCRSIRVPALNGNMLGNRPMKASTEQGLLREWADKNELDDAPKTRDGLPFGSKGAFDEFARRRVRELTGTVPAATTYQEWLSAQSAAFQDDILGPTRGKLFRSGGITLDKFVNRQGDEITLAELATKQAEAFRAAGLDPGAY